MQSNANHPPAAAGPAADSNSTTVVTPSNTDAAAGYLKKILANVTLQDGKVSEVIFAPANQGRCFYVSMNRLIAARGWNLLTDKEGHLLPDLKFEDLFTILFRGTEGSVSTTVVYRLATIQVRCHYLNGGADCRRIFLRVQPLAPPLLSQQLSRFPNTLKYLSDATGLVLVCGPIGSGKSTFAASLMNHLAERERHIITIEDPVEYWLSPQKGLVTHIEASFMDQPSDTRPRLTDLIPQTMRSRMHGLYIGETRSAKVLETALAFSGAREAVVTTFHSGSIADCLIRTITMASETMPLEVAKLVLSQRLHAIIYVNLAYRANGEAVPVIMCLPGRSTQVRNLIASFNPSTIKQDVDNAFNQARSTGSISATEAQAEAVQSGATPASVAEALPPVT